MAYLLPSRCMLMWPCVEYLLLLRVMLHRLSCYCTLSFIAIVIFHLPFTMMNIMRGSVYDGVWAGLVVFRLLSFRKISDVITVYPRKGLYLRLQDRVGEFCTRYLDGIVPMKSAEWTVTAALLPVVVPSIVAVSHEYGPSNDVFCHHFQVDTDGVHW